MINEIYQLAFYASLGLLITIGVLNFVSNFLKPKGKLTKVKRNSALANARKQLGFRRFLIPSVTETNKPSTLLNLLISLFIVLIMAMWFIYFWISWPTIKLLVTRGF